MTKRTFSALVPLFVAASSPLLAQALPEETPTDQVICVVCGDYTFDRKDGTPATYEGEKIWLCSVNELDLIKKNPNKYVWGTDPVSGARVNKIQAKFTADRRVKVRKKDGTVEVWPRRFFFESEKTRNDFLKNPERFVKEPYPV